MDQQTIIGLIRPAIISGAYTWADFGSGEGAFTIALRTLLGSEGQIISVDENAQALQQQEAMMLEQFGPTNITFVTSDFYADLDLKNLDGILMANAMHFAQDKDALLQQLHIYLKPNAKLLLVEYDIDHGNQYVPFPVSFNKLGAVLERSGFGEPELIGTAPSKYWDRMYSALARKK